MTEQIVSDFRENLGRYMRASDRGAQRSALFDLPLRSMLGGACFYENLPELLAKLDRPPGEIGGRMRVLGSRPYQMHLNSMMFGYLTGMQEREATGGADPAGEARLAATVTFWKAVTDVYRADGADYATGTQQVVPAEALAAWEPALDAAEGRHPAAREVGLMQSMNFLMHGESRDGLFDHGPYPGRDGGCTVVKELTDLRGAVHAWAEPSGAQEFPLGRVVVLRRLTLPGDALWFDMFGTMTAAGDADIGEAITHELVLASDGDEPLVPIGELVSADDLRMAIRTLNRNLLRNLAGLEDRIAYGGDMYANMLLGFGAIGSSDPEAWEAELRERFAASTVRALERIRGSAVAGEVWARIGGVTPPAPQAGR